MALKSAADENPGDPPRLDPPLKATRTLAEWLLIPVALSLDLVIYALRTLLALAVPIVLLLVGLYMVAGQFMHPDKDTSSASSTVTALLVALGSLGFTWAAAIDRTDQEYPLIMSISRQFMLAALALILGTAFKYVLRSAEASKMLPWGDGLAGNVLTFLMVCFFLQAFLESLVPIWTLYRHLADGHVYRSGMGRLRKRMPGFHDRFARLLGLDRLGAKRT